MRTAWYFANVCLDLISGSGSLFQIASISRNVDAANSVSAVFLVTVFAAISLSPFVNVCSANCSQ